MIYPCFFPVICGRRKQGWFSCGDTMLIVECGQMRFMVFYNLYFLHLSVYLTHGYRTIHLSHSSGEILMSECLKHSMTISWESSSANMVPSWSLTNCLSPSSSLQDISPTYISSPAGCFCGYGFWTIPGFPAVQVRHTPTGLFSHRSKPPRFHMPRNAPNAWNGR